jgi:hypothetical protein
MTYGLPHQDNSSHGAKVFRMQKYAIRILMGCKKRESCRNLFKKLKILPLASQYILSLATFVNNNTHQFTTNSEIHNKNKRRLNNFYPPKPNLPK